MNILRHGILLLFIFWLAAISRITLAGLPETVLEVKPSIVAIGTYMPTRNPRANFVGTGFVVGDGRHVITNSHVVPKLLESARKETLTVFTGSGKQATGRPAELVAKDDTHDLALLRIRGKALPALKLGDASRVREGQEYAFTGFPIGMVLGLYPVTHKGIVSSKTPIVIPAMSSRNLTAKQIRSMRNPFKVFQLDAIAYPGNSGSPLYEIGTGRVVGVVNSVFVKETKEAILSSPSGIAYAIPVKYVKSLMKKIK